MLPFLVLISSAALQIYALPAARCSWPGHCLGATCRTNNDCDGALFCNPDSKKCAVDPSLDKPAAGGGGRNDITNPPNRHTPTNNNSPAPAPALAQQRSPAPAQQANQNKLAVPAPATPPTPASPPSTAAKPTPKAPSPVVVIKENVLPNPISLRPVVNANTQAGAASTTSDASPKTEIIVTKSLPATMLSVSTETLEIGTSSSSTATALQDATLSPISSPTILGSLEPQQSSPIISASSIQNETDTASSGSSIASSSSSRNLTADSTKVFTPVVVALVVAAVACALAVSFMVGRRFAATSASTDFNGTGENKDDFKYYEPSAGQTVSEPAESEAEIRGISSRLAYPSSSMQSGLDSYSTSTATRTLSSQSSLSIGGKEETVESESTAASSPDNYRYKSVRSRSVISFSECSNSAVSTLPESMERISDFYYSASSNDGETSSTCLSAPDQPLSSQKPSHMKIIIPTASSIAQSKPVPLSIKQLRAEIETPMVTSSPMSTFFPAFPKFKSFDFIDSARYIYSPK